MNDIKQKALVLVNEIERERGEDELTPRIMRGLILDEALCRAIEQHEAFRQEVSDVIQDTLRIIEGRDLYNLKYPLSKFIIPKPKPDPLVEVLSDLDWLSATNKFRAALEARGLEIREKNDD